MAVAIYARVSTNKHRCRSCRATFTEKTGTDADCFKCGSADIERSQTPETQLLPLRKYAQSRGAAEILEYVDRKSSRRERPELERLLRDARKRLFDLVVIVRFDRFARSTKELILALEEFHELGIAFVSLNEAIDTSTAMGKLFFTIIGAIAEFERSLIRERAPANGGTVFLVDD